VAIGGYHQSVTVLIVRPLSLPGCLFALADYINGAIN